MDTSTREWYNLKEQAERLYRAKAKAKCTSDLRDCVERCKDFVDMLRINYGNDSDINWLINEYRLDWDS